MPPPAPGASGRAIASLVLGILGIVMCGFLTAIPAAILGKMELNAIQRGESPIAGKGLATAGFWIGTIISACSCIAAIAYAVIMIVAGTQGAYNTY
jgi:hypothetical protein